jgi:hypothetical protein
MRGVATCMPPCCLYTQSLSKAQSESVLIFTISTLLSSETLSFYSDTSERGTLTVGDRTRELLPIRRRFNLRITSGRLATRVDLP